jgi:hypothetical protein
MSKTLVIVLVLFAVCVSWQALAFAPVFTHTRAKVTRGRAPPLMDGKSNYLKKRIVSVKNTRRITEAMRLVAAAKV